jgi:cell wall-associated NlpC family hydrolase
MDLSNDTHRQESIDRLVNTALNYVGVPTHKYSGVVRGMNPIDGFDCSGFICYLFNEIGLSLPTYFNRSGIIHHVRHAREWFDFAGEYITDGSHNRGDLVFFSNGGNMPTHVGLLTNPKQMIHASPKHHDKVLIENVDEYIAKLSIKPGKRFTHNPIGYKRVIF